MKTSDAIIIGADQPGPALARRLTAAGKSVAFVERNLFGGTCVNTGCTPTKTMVASAYVAHMARRAWDYGAKVECNTDVDMKTIIARCEAIVNASRNGIDSSLSNNQKITVFRGTAAFESPEIVRVGEDLLQASQIFLKTLRNARPFRRFLVSTMCRISRILRS